MAKTTMGLNEHQLKAALDLTKAVGGERTREQVLKDFAYFAALIEKKDGDSSISWDVWLT